ncbi:MAG: DNA (cytosine-5-)-methyltransferase, partial [Verrucomicrobiaceae bacterium]
AELLERSSIVTSGTALLGLPKLRSRLSSDDSPLNWKKAVSDQGKKLSTQARELDMNDLAVRLKLAANNISEELPIGDFRFRRSSRLAAGEAVAGELGAWISDPQLKVHLNHDARSHMASDLGRYLYAAAFAEVNGKSPKGHKDFALEGLAPDHKNWKSGKFVDRFRVQRAQEPSKTVTSHISKDGHAFIHPDPEQARSLSVREAARLQTFPDNYFFTGGRTDQYHQVGNAVPPLLAAKIAGVVQHILK